MPEACKCQLAKPCARATEASNQRRYDPAETLTPGAEVLRCCYADTGFQTPLYTIAGPVATHHAQPPGTAQHHVRPCLDETEPLSGWPSATRIKVIAAVPAALSPAVTTSAAAFQHWAMP